MRWTGHVELMGKKIGEYRGLVGKPEGKRPLEKPRRRWEDNTKWIFKKWDRGMGWSDVTQDRD
jgi:hypothetical protein